MLYFLEGIFLILLLISSAFSLDINEAKMLANPVAGLKSLVDTANDRIESENEYYENLLEGVNIAQEQDALEFLSLQTPKTQVSEDNNQKTINRITIFTSFSMPKELLWSYFIQAKQYGGKLVIRGLVDNSFKSTIKAMQIDQGRTLVLEINPELFKKHQVTQVPTIIVNKNDQEFDKFTGSVTIAYVLDQAGPQ